MNSFVIPLSLFYALDVLQRSICNRWCVAAAFLEYFPTCCFNNLFKEIGLVRHLRTGKKVQKKITRGSSVKNISLAQQENTFQQPVEIYEIYKRDSFKVMLL